MHAGLISRDTAPTGSMGLSTIKAPRPVLPTEVVEQIINALAESMDVLNYFTQTERLDSLRACALVGRSWVPRTRLHLFRHIILHSDSRTKRFLISLALSPGLGQYVEILQIWPDDEENSCGWIFRALSILPPLLPHLHELVLRELPNLHPSCVVILSSFHTVESLVLSRLKRQSLREIVQLIGRFSQLRRLHVQQCCWELPGQYYSGKQHNLTTLEMFSNPLECECSLQEWAITSGSTRALTTFCPDSYVAGMVVDRVLQTCCSTLRELHISIDDNHVPLLTNHLSLQYLHLAGDPDEVIPVLARLPLFAPSSLIGICFKPSPFEYLERTPETQWKAVDLALCDSKFPHFKSVEFTYTLSGPPKNPHALFQRALPNSYMRGILWLRDGNTGERTRIAPVGAPQYPEIPFEWGRTLKTRQ